MVRHFFHERRTSARWPKQAEAACLSSGIWHFVGCGPVHVCFGHATNGSNEGLLITLAKVYREECLMRRHITLNKFINIVLLINGKMKKSIQNSQAVILVLRTS